jgi:hypothetical protein
MQYFTHHILVQRGTAPSSSRMSGRCRGNPAARCAKQISQAIIVAISRDAHAMTRLFLHATSTEILRSG